MSFHLTFFPKISQQEDNIIQVSDRPQTNQNRNPILERLAQIPKIEPIIPNHFQWDPFQLKKKHDYQINPEPVIAISKQVQDHIKRYVSKILYDQVFVID
jgi:hypothetical protein